MGERGHSAPVHRHSTVTRSPQAGLWAWRCAGQGQMPGPGGIGRQAQDLRR